jgi:hypothetical protein
MILFEMTDDALRGVQPTDCAAHRAADSPLIDRTEPQAAPGGRCASSAATSS